jgi:hypothetical protein
VIFLRPHHLLCLLNFQGKGYSEAFIQNVVQILNTLKNKHNEQLICVVNGCDDICKSCPQKTQIGCRDEKKISALDMAYTKILNVNERDVFSFCKMQQIIAKLHEHEFQRICKTCCWFDICLDLRYKLAKTCPG